MPRTGWRAAAILVVLALAGFAVGRALRGTPERPEALATRTRPLMGTLVEIRLPAPEGAIDERGYFHPTFTAAQTPTES